MADLRFCRRVAAVDSSPAADGRATVTHCSDWTRTEGSPAPPPERTAADAVVVTLPLGVLKRGAVAFTPPLSPAKQRAIARLGYGLLNKIVLTFSAAFWGDDLDAFGLVQSPETASRGRCFQLLSLQVISPPRARHSLPRRDAAGQHWPGRIASAARPPLTALSCCSVRSSSQSSSR